MRRKLFSILFSLMAIHSFAQMAVGEWQAHLSYNNLTQTAPAGKLIYGLSDGALFAYDKEDQSIQTFDKINSLNDNSIGYIKYSEPLKMLIIVYKNSNIDLLVDGKVYNISDFKNKIMNQDKTVNSVHVEGDYAYLSTNFGILVLNLTKREFTNTYVLNKKVYASVIKDQQVVAATDQGVYVGNINKNLLDNANWSTLNNQKLVFSQLLLFENKLIACDPQKGLFQYDENSNTTTSLVTGNFTFANVYDDKLIAGNNNTLAIFDHYNSFKLITLNDSFKHLSYSKGDQTYWGSNGSKGLNGYKWENNTLTVSNSSIAPNSPIRNLPYYMTFSNDNQLLVCGGGMTTNRLNNPGTVMMLDKHRNWVNFEEEGIANKSGVLYLDITSVAQDPMDPTHHFASSGGQGVYEFKDNKFVKLYNFTNSTLQTILPDISDKYYYVRTDGLRFDKNNNLWMVNSIVNNILNVLKPDGKWISFNHPEISKKEKFEKLIIDKRGWVWITSTFKTPGVFCFNTNNTLEDIKDDKTKFIDEFINQDGVNIGMRYVLSIAEDKKGAIWVGTDKGPIVLNNPSKLFDGNVIFTQIKVPRNDGTNLADFLLDKERITAICVDGANRKWIGTSANGVFLLSEDGLESIQHFTTTNSPLLSDNIQSIAIHPKTGEVFIGTSQGLVSYKGDATEAESEFSEDAHAFPNPVRPDYTGVITVTGLVKDSNVKIADINGNVLYSGTSLGGQFIWNGKDRSGKRASSGVYLVLATDAEGKEGIATKILMIN